MAANNKKSSPQPRQSSRAKKSSANGQQSQENLAKKSWLRWTLSTCFKLALVVLLALGLYAIYLDGKVRANI